MNQVSIHLMRLFNSIREGSHFTCASFNLDVAPWDTNTTKRSIPLPVDAVVPENYVVTASKKWNINPKGRCIFLSKRGYKALRPEIEQLLKCRPVPKTRDGHELTITRVDKVFTEAMMRMKLIEVAA